MRYNIDGDNDTFESMQDASISTYNHTTNISKFIKGVRKNSQGYVWNIPPNHLNLYSLRGDTNLISSG